MLKVTAEAAYVLKAAREGAGATPTSGLRIRRSETAEEGSLAIRMGFQENPEPTDHTLEQDGLRVFVATEVADSLSDRTLDVEATDHGAEILFRDSQ